MGVAFYFDHASVSPNSQCFSVATRSGHPDYPGHLDTLSGSK